MTVLRITDETTREDLAEALGHMCAFAKRQPCVVARLSTDEPTDWDRAHRRMDGPLSDYLAAKA